MRSISKVLKADTNTNRVIGFSSSEYLTNGHPETTTTGFNLVPGTLMDYIIKHISMGFYHTIIVYCY